MLRQVRSKATEFKTREDGENPIIEGYFAVFNSNYDIGLGMSESIAQGAFSNSLGNDIRALINHDTTLVLGRNKAGTLTLTEDSHGLWGHIDINPNDVDAMNLYERVKRGDVDQCSFGFFPKSEETEIKDNGDVHWTITDVDLFEVSCCTFPAYEATNISARSDQKEKLIASRLESWKEAMKTKLKGAQEDA